MVAATASCKDIGLADVLIGAQEYLIPSSDSTLSFWACKSIPTPEQDPTYYIYLSALGDSYETQIGNITCTISPIQPAVFLVTYQSSTRVFSTQKQITTSAPANSFSDLIEYALSGLGGIFQLAQTQSNNLVAASVLDLGFQALGFGENEQNEHYLPLYEAMIQGILVDEVCTASNSSLQVPLLMLIPQVTYLRFLYSMTSNTPPPASCNRTVNRIMNAEVTGWVAKPVHIAFLMPMTIINLASLVIMLIAIVRAKRSHDEFDPTDLRPLLFAEPSLDESDPSGWADGVSYRSREVRTCHIWFWCWSLRTSNWWCSSGQQKKPPNERAQSPTRSDGIPLSSHILSLPKYNSMGL